MKYLIANTDGGSRGNPGPAACAAVIRHGEQVIDKVGGYIGEATNNVAEYKGIIVALQYAVEKKAKGLFIYSDSELVVKQMIGDYSLSSDQLIPLWAEASALAQQLEVFGIEHIRRHLNTEADALCNLHLDAAKLLGKY